MSERFNNDTTLRSEGLGPTQGQGQGQHNIDSSTRDPRSTGPDILSEDRVPAQGQGQYDVDTQNPRLGNRVDDPRQEKNQSADPDFTRQDPTRGQPDQYTRPQDNLQQGRQGQYPPQGQQDQRRQGGQITSDKLPGTYVEPRQAEYKAGCYHQGGGTTGTGPGSGPGRQDIPSDGGFGSKPTLPERVMGATEKMVGKATGNARMYQHGQDRQQGGY